MKETEGQGGDQDQEERRWNKRTQQMLHGLQVQIFDHLRVTLKIVNLEIRKSSSNSGHDLHHKKDNEFYFIDGIFYLVNYLFRVEFCSLSFFVY